MYKFICIIHINIYGHICIQMCTNIYIYVYVFIHISSSTSSPLGIIIVSAICCVLSHVLDSMFWVGNNPYKRLTHTDLGLYELLAGIFMVLISAVLGDHNDHDDDNEDDDTNNGIIRINSYIPVYIYVYIYMYIYICIYIYI
jgi:ascorbate-specific PTS system EIIC-type component UlaA